MSTREKKISSYGTRALVLVALISLIAGVLFTASFDLTDKSEAQDFWKEPGKSPAVELKSTPVSFVELTKKLSPAVVNISTTQVIKHSPLAPFYDFKSPFDEFFGDDFNEFFGPRGRREEEFKRQSLGSGFIINKDGYIMTNNHVVEKATEIIVRLSDNKESYPATVIGKDPVLDLALIKIEADHDLPVVTLGDSDGLEVGEWVFAIGNPFGLGGSVTAGIVSQKGRVIGAGPYDNFIQTDASINPGNSGGPLFNLSGEVVGINTAIIAGGSGIGFAIPVNMAKNILIQLKEEGKAIRGWIGVTIQEVTEDIATSFGLVEARGALVSSVTPGDPAEKAGLEPGDVIIEFDGVTIDDPKDLQRAVASTPPASEVPITVIRNGEEKNLRIKVARKKEGFDIASEEDERLEEKDAVSLLGLSLATLTPDLAKRFGIEEGETGVIVISVEDASPAERAGILRGDIIVEVNRRPVSDIEDFNREAGKVEEDGVVLFLVKRGKNYYYTTVRPKD